MRLKKTHKQPETKKQNNKKILLELCLSGDTKFPTKVTPLPHLLLSMEQSFIFYQYHAHTWEAYLKCKPHIPCSDIQ